jgi:hypothetical protein
MFSKIPQHLVLDCAIDYLKSIAINHCYKLNTTDIVILTNRYGRIRIKGLFSHVICSEEIVFVTFEKVNICRLAKLTGNNLLCTICLTI